MLALKLMLVFQVAILEEQLQKERDLKATLEAGLNMHSRDLLTDGMDPKVGFLGIFIYLQIGWFKSMG